MEDNKKPDWERIGGYTLIVGSLASLFFYIADMKERTRALEVKVDFLEAQVKVIPALGSE